MEEPKEGGVEERVLKALEICRPFLIRDGGDIELLRISEGIVEVMLKGTCTYCPMSPMTLRAGIERAIMRLAPEITRVEAVRVP